MKQTKRRTRRHRPLMLEWLQSRANKRVLIIAGAVLVLLLLLLLIKPEQELMNTPEIRAIEENGVLRVGIRTDMPGFSDGESGLEIRLAEEMAERLFPDLDPLSALDLYELSAKSAAAHISNDDVDLVIALQIKDSSTAFAYSSAYYTDELVYLYVAGSGGFDPRTATVGTIQQSVAATRFKNWLTAEELDLEQQVNFASYPDLFAALRSGRIQLALVQGAYAKKYAEEGFSRLAEPFDTVEYAAACGTDSTAIVQLFDLMLDELKEEGTLAAMLQEYSLD
ncbi:MAG: transporter substrate-binding domain-containing protein [Clostridia bacterium]|nr:transporter substrate-binding domain-containing protein [Clostridia bacterium]